MALTWSSACNNDKVRSGKKNTREKWDRREMKGVQWKGKETNGNTRTLMKRTRKGCCLQDAKFSAQVASLESEVRILKADNARLSKDNKTCYCQIRAKDKQLDSAAKEVEHARHTELQNKVTHLTRMVKQEHKTKSSILFGDSDKMSASVVNQELLMVRAAQDYSSKGIARRRGMKGGGLQKPLA